MPQTRVKTAGNTARSLIVAASFILMVTVNALSALLPLNGVTPQDVSAMYPNLFVPAGYTFSIWSVIYLALLFYTLYELGLFRGKQPANETLLNKTAVMFAVSSAANAAWLFCWHYGAIALSVVVMLLLLVSLIILRYITAENAKSWRERALVQIPFSLYFGWITVATVANITALLVHVSWDGFGLSAPLWTVLILAVAAIIGTLTTLRFRDPAYALVLIWAYGGILVSHVSPAGHAGAYPVVIWTAIICMALFAAALVLSLLRKKPRT
ncbi:MAG TPA: tryptophan-rich sensory protein [Eubacteriales bacterium]|nr:tryptophan-rich sensory protein [Eubacteriales bacterium]